MLALGAGVADSEVECRAGVADLVALVVEEGSVEGSLAPVEEDLAEDSPVHVEALAEALAEVVEAMAELE